ncbi:hypothetical protein J6590_000255 [Homalodisca vitripennis]|nr:hypothetical protein J6590_000255 [Homalodisca vitripennis]
MKAPRAKQRKTAYRHTDIYCTFAVVVISNTTFRDLQSDVFFRVRITSKYLKCSETLTKAEVLKISEHVSGQKRLKRRETSMASTAQSPEFLKTASIPQNLYITGNKKSPYAEMPTASRIYEILKVESLLRREAGTEIGKCLKRDTIE